MGLKREIPRWISNIYFSDKRRNIDFTRSLTDGNLIRKCVYKVFDLAVCMVKETLLRRLFLSGEHLTSSST